MNRTRYIPSIVMLSAALVSCIATIYFKYTTKEILWIVLVTSVIFFIIGQVIRRIAEKYLVISSMEETLIEEDGETSENEEEDNASEKEKKDGKA